MITIKIKFDYDDDTVILEQGKDRYRYIIRPTSQVESIFIELINMLQSPGTGIYRIEDNEETTLGEWT